jgi:RimJ/RimL family protein N-acetyltransferase
VEIVEFGPDDGARLQAFLAVARAADAIDAPWEPPRTAYRQAMFMRHSWEGEPGRWFVAYDGEAPVGVASLDASEYDNLEMAWVQLTIAPDLRGRGHGSALLADLERVAREMGRPLVLLSGWDGPGLDRLAGGRGYTRRSTEVRRLLHLGEAPDPRPIRDEALALAGDYELVHIEGPTPEDLLLDVVALTESINDAPLDDLEWEDEVFSAGRVRAYEHAQLESGHRFRRVIARHRRTGRLAGHTVIVVDSDQPTCAEQHDTSVLRAHRGHRLGLLLKVEMLLGLAEAEPQLERIYTNNAESNRHMIAVNDRLGFRPVGRIAEFQRRLDRVADRV